MLHGNAFRSLSPNARSLLIELVMLYNGENNGSLYLSVRDAAHRMGIADLTAASRAFDDLAVLGFIQLTKEAFFSVKAANASRARCWRLTWEPGPEGRAPTWDFMQQEPKPRTKAHKRMERGQRAIKTFRKARDSGKLPVLDSTTLETFRPSLAAGAVSEIDTLISKNGNFRPMPFVRDSATHSAIPWGRKPRSSLVGWWQPDWPSAITQLAFTASLADEPHATLSEHAAPPKNLNICKAVRA